MPLSMSPSCSLFETLQEEARRYWALESREEIECSPFSKGASGRWLARLSHPQHRSLVGVAWTLERADNNAFVPVARFLKEEGLSVPSILTHQEVFSSEGELNYAYALTQDLGDKDLLSLKASPWAEKKLFYQKALEQVLKIHRSHPDFPLQAPFDSSLYTWEQDYFATHFLGTYLPLEGAESFSSSPEMQALADFLAQQARVPIHRDFQSQNILLQEQKAFLIDFQGMRMGLGEYDLASLLYDPYMELGREERDELLLYWQELTGASLCLELFYSAALQRLMQALGAFANIGLNQQKTWYLEQIAPARKALEEILSTSNLAKPWFNKVSSLLSSC